MPALTPWLCEPLMYWEGERQIHGILIPEGVEVTGENYHLYHDQKVFKLIETERHPDPEVLFENLIPSYEPIGETNPKRLFEWVDANYGGLWKGDRYFVSQYLRKEISENELIEHMGLSDIKKDEKPTVHEFRKELMQFSLWEFLESVTVM